MPGRDKFSPEYRGLIAHMIAARRKSKLTQAQIADLLGVRQPALSKLENGQHQFGLLDFVRYCKAVDLDPRPSLEILMAPDGES